MVFQQAKCLKHFLFADMFAYAEKITEAYMAIFHSILWDKEFMTKSHYS